MTEHQKDKTSPAPIVSGSYQIVGDQEKEQLKELEKSNQLDEEIMYYARIFMED